jgi:hypothetical protein
VGDVLEVAFDGPRLLEAQDPTFAGPGKVGLWTKADSLIHFADFVIRPPTRQSITNSDGPTMPKLGECCS